jgi:hypothetical protein
METKKCSCCLIEKNVSEFGLKKTNKDGLQSRCKECRKIESEEYKLKYPNRNKIYYEKNKETLLLKNKEWYKNNPNYSKEWALKNVDKIKVTKKKNYENNKEKIKIKKTEYRNRNKDKIREKSKIYREKNKELLNNKKRDTRKKNLEYYREKERIRFEENPHLKLIRKYRNRIKNYMKYNKVSINTGTIDIVGLSADELKKYLESKFTEGMCWENYGLYGWHIDHIIPLSSAKNEEELIKLCHYTNLQPLWSFDNLSKHNKILI